MLYCLKMLHIAVNQDSNMITENSDSITFNYPYSVLEADVNMLTSYLAGDDFEKLKTLELNSGHSLMFTHILQSIVPKVYTYFIDASVNVVNGYTANHDGVNVKIDRRMKDASTAAYSRNRLLLIDGLLKDWIVRHALSEWILVQIKDDKLAAIALKDEQVITDGLIENLCSVNSMFESKSYTVTEL